MKKLLGVMLLAVSLTGCATMKLTQEGEGVRLVKDYEIIKGCKYLTPILAQSGPIMTMTIGNPNPYNPYDTSGVAFERASFDLRNKTALAGGDTAYLTAFSGDRMMGEAYLCNFPLTSR